MRVPDEHMIALVDEAADLARRQQLRAEAAEAEETRLSASLLDMASERDVALERAEEAEHRHAAAVLEVGRLRALLAEVGRTVAAEEYAHVDLRQAVAALVSTSATPPDDKPGT